MIAWLQSVFGTYTPPTYTDGGIDIIPSGAAGVDWQYVAGIAIFLVFVVCIFKTIGKLISK